MSDEDGLGNDGTEIFRQASPDDSDDQMNEKDDEIPIAWCQTEKTRDFGPSSVIRHGHVLIHSPQSLPSLCRGPPIGISLGGLQGYFPHAVSLIVSLSH